MKSGSRHLRAVGLEYQSGQGEAPTVRIKGEHLIADEIIRIARRYGVPVVEKPELAQALNRVEVDREIPESLFKPVAIILNRLLSQFTKK